MCDTASCLTCNCPFRSLVLCRILGIHPGSLSSTNVPPDVLELVRRIPRNVFEVVIHTDEFTGHEHIVRGVRPLEAVSDDDL